MWLNREITESMFVEKVKNQRKELERAGKQNKELKNKQQYLEGEEKKLIDLVNSNQVTVLTKKNNLNSLLEEFRIQKQQNLNIAQRLAIYNEQIESIQSCIHEINCSNLDSITNLEPVKEETLSFKWDVVECLQNMLIETRLQVAEKDAITSELQKHETYLKNELKILTENDIGTNAISQWQEEFLLARIREADVILEFDKVKRDIAVIKRELQEQIEAGQTNEDEESFHIQFKFKDAFREQLKKQEEASIAKTVKLQDEVDHLKIKIKTLEDAKKDISSHVVFNEEVKVHLHEVISSVFQRLQKTNRELEQAIEQRKQLEEKMRQNFEHIQGSIDVKDDDISRLTAQINQLQLQNEDFMKSNDSSLVYITESTINKLEEEIKELEEKIKILKLPELEVNFPG